MDSTLKIIKMIALLSVAFVCCSVGYEVLQARVLIAQGDVVLKKAGTTLDALQATTAKLDLTIKELQYPILQAGVTSKKEADMLDGWNAEITRTLRDVDAAVVTLDASTASVSNETVQAMRQIGSTVENVNPALNQATLALEQSQVELQSANRILTDPNIARTLANTADATEHMSATTSDVQGAVHAYLHPSWKVRLFNWSMSVVHALGGWF